MICTFYLVSFFKKKIGVSYHTWSGSVSQIPVSCDGTEITHLVWLFYSIFLISFEIISIRSSITYANALMCDICEWLNKKSIKSVLHFDVFFSRYPWSDQVEWRHTELEIRYFFIFLYFHIFFSFGIEYLCWRNSHECIT